MASFIHVTKRINRGVKAKWRVPFFMTRTFGNFTDHIYQRRFGN